MTYSRSAEALGHWEIRISVGQGRVQWIISPDDTLFSAAILYDSSESDKKKLSIWLYLLQSYGQFSNNVINPLLFIFNE